MNASGRLNTCKSWGSMTVAIQLMATGKRVWNTYTTSLRAGNSPGKPGLIPHKILNPHGIDIKAPALEDGCAPD